MAALPSHNPIQHRFSPYTSNGGSILAIAGNDFCVVAGDTRQSEGYQIQSRYERKVFRLTDTAVIATNGFAADAKTLVKRIKQRIEWYGHAHAHSPSLPAIARLIQTMLYGKRFFPYYVYVILGGIDVDGTGAVYSFDPVGSYKRETCRAAGAAQSLLQPFLDNMINNKNQLSNPASPLPSPGTLPLPRALAIVTDSFTGATERHIEVGDGLEMFLIRKGQTGGPDGLDGLRELQATGATLSVEEEGGEDGTVVVIRRELKKD